MDGGEDLALPFVLVLEMFSALGTSSGSGGEQRNQDALLEDQVRLHRRVDIRDSIRNRGGGGGFSVQRRIRDRTRFTQELADAGRRCQRIPRRAVPASTSAIGADHPSSIILPSYDVE